MIREQRERNKQFGQLTFVMWDEVDFFLFKQVSGAQEQSSLQIRPALLQLQDLQVDTATSALFFLEAPHWHRLMSFKTDVTLYNLVASSMIFFKRSCSSAWREGSSSEYS